MRLDTWSVRDGLPSRDIMSVVQTPDGFIWLATYAGLIRFDGVNFDTYDTTNTPSLPSNLITCLLVSRTGELWVGTEWGGFGKFEDGKFIRYQPIDKQWSRVYAMTEDPEGGIWIGAWGHQPLRRVYKNRVTIYDLQTGDPGANALLPYGSDSVIVGMPWAKPKIVDSNGRITPIWADHHFDYPCSSLLRDRDGSIWYGTGRTGLVHIQGHRYTTYDQGNGLASKCVGALFQDRCGRLWVGTTNGLDVWDGHGFSYFGKIDGLYDSSVACISQDAEGNVWVGSGVGLNRFAATKLQAFTLSVGSDTAFNDRIGADGADGAWCATNMGMWHLSPTKTVRCEYLSRLEGHFEGVDQGADGALWAFTDHASGVYDVWHIQPNRKGANLDPDSLASVDSKPDVTCTKLALPWPINVAVPDGNSLIAFSPNRVSRILPGKLAWTKTGMPDSFQFCGEYDSRGNLWVGSTAGLIRWANNRETLMNDGLPVGTHVLALDASDANDIWLATDHGLAEFQNGRSSVFGAESGLPDTNLFEILRDRHNNLWIGSNVGITRIAEQDIEAYRNHRAGKIAYRLFGTSDGIRSFPTEYIAARDATGKLWFSGNRSVTLADPDLSVLNPVKPSVSIEEATVDGIPLSVNSVVSIAPGAGRFSIRFAGLSFQAPEKVRFKYKLEGLDSNWTDAVSSRSAFYPFLPPGRYSFRVIASNNDGIWNFKGATVTFILRPHYYETAWFKTLCLVTFVLFLIGLYYVRVRQIVNHSRELERQVAKRTSQLLESNKQLQEAQATLAAHYDELADRNRALEAVQAELKAHNEELRQTRETLAKANAHLEALATTDGLTALKNHRSFQVQLEIEWERYKRYGHYMSVIMIDVDRFKQYNDTFGHPGGDEVLKRVSTILKGIARESDFVARYGGEEFVVIAPETDEAGAVKLAERMRVAIEYADWTLRSVTASFGVATASIVMQSGADLLAASDAALLRSKADGRNRVTAASSAEIHGVTAE
jgi:diguanylate cyclase (GGDEF)-like protein